jgi:hypothetical protein
VSDTRAIQVKYSCFKCGINRVLVAVPARQDEDVVEWMNKVCAPALSADHDRRSPHCRITKLDEVMIPLYEDSDKIGGAGVVPQQSTEGII